MTHLTRLRLGVALPIALMSQAAYADLTPAQVWGDWQQYLTSMGYQVTADETLSGGDLTVQGIELTMDLPDDGGALSMSMGTIGFAQNRDGSVAIEMPDTMPIDILVTPLGEDAFAMKFDFTQSGQAMTVSGTPEEMTFAHKADSSAFMLTELTADGTTYGAENAKIDVTGTDVSSTTVITTGALRDYKQTGKIASLAYDIFMDNPDEDVKVQMTGTMNDVAFDGTGAIPLVIADTSNMAAMMKDGFAMSGKFSFGSGATQVEITDPENGAFAGTSTSAGGSLGIEMKETLLAYSGEQNGIEVNVQTAQLPFPISMSMAKGSFNLGMPISKSDTPQDFAFGITMADFTMSDMIWSIFDPTGQLPRDPATIALDLSGKAKILADLMDPAAAAQMSTSGPGELDALTLNKLLVTAAGATIEGTGDFTFDNTDKVTFDGMPKPIGAVSISVAGANGLIDKLVAMGLLPEQQAMGARMMMGLFAVPGDAPDTLSSKVEFTSEGQILANGQRLK